MRLFIIYVNRFVGECVYQTFRRCIIFFLVVYIRCMPLLGHLTPNVRLSRPAHLAKTTARVRLLRRLVERLALIAQLLRLHHQVVQLLAALQYRGDRVLEYDLRLVQVVLHLRQLVALARILILGQVGGQQCEIDRLLAGGRRPQFAGHARTELVQHLGDERVRDALRILVVGNQDAGQAVGAHVHVAHVDVLLDRLARGQLRAIDDRFAGEAAEVESWRLIRTDTQKYVFIQHTIIIFIHIYICSIIICWPLSC